MRVTVRHQEACWVMSNSFPEWLNFSVYTKQPLWILFLAYASCNNLYALFYQYYTIISTFLVKKCSVQLLLTTMLKCLAENDFLHTRPGFPWTRPGLGNVILNEGFETTLVHDVSMTILTSFFTSWRHFHVSFCQTFQHQCIREEPYRTFLDRKM